MSDPRHVAAALRGIMEYADYNQSLEYTMTQMEVTVDEYNEAMRLIEQLADELSPPSRWVE